jgi:hypothetical protein
MKLHLDEARMPCDAVFFTCVTEEDRSRGVLERSVTWRPCHTVIVTYCGDNPRRDSQLRRVKEVVERRSLVHAITECDEASPARCLKSQVDVLAPLVGARQLPLVIDISVFTKRNLLMLWRWLDDINAWDRVTVVYSEPDSYVVSKYIPLTFGLESLQQIPGSPGVADCSRPVHLVLLLGYEGDRALAVYEQIQPMQTTLFVPHPPYRPEWEGRTEEFNCDLLNLTGNEHVKRVDAIDPEATASMLRTTIGPAGRRNQNAVVICPLGTKPQTLGVFEYIRESYDPPAVLYANPLRHNKSFYSEGIGQSWILKERS